MDAQSATNLLENMAHVTESYFGMAMFSYFISGILVTLIPLSAIAKFYKPLANKSTQTDATTNTIDCGTGDDIEPQQDTYYGNGEIDLEAEKKKTYIKAVLDCYEDVTDQELKRTMKYLQRKRVTMIDAANFAKAIIYLRSHDHNMEEDDETAEQGHEAAREELIRILIASGYEDAEDVVGRYERTYPGSVPTKDEFVDFYETLRGIVDLEKKLAREKVEKRKAEQEKRKAEQEKMSLAEIKDQQIEEEKRKAEQEKRKAEQEKRKAEQEKRKAEQEKRKAEQEKMSLAEIKDQQIEEEKRKAEQEKRSLAAIKDKQIEEEKRKALDLEIQAQRSLCKICFTEEVGVLCLPCNHLYSCTHCADVVKQQGHCHMCYKTVNTFLPISLS